MMMQAMRGASPRSSLRSVDSILPKQIFLSYTTGDFGFAQYLHTLLEQAGFSTWMDKKCLDPGMDWTDEIERNLNASSALVVVMSPEARESQFVKTEVLTAMKRQKPIFPVLLAGEEPFYYLSTYQWADMRQGLSAQLSPSFVDGLRSAVGAPEDGPSGDCGKVCFDIVQGDVRHFGCDVMVLKYANCFMGAASAITTELERNDIQVDESTLEEGTRILLPTNNAIQPRNVLFVPTEGLLEFSYQSIREFTIKLFEVLSQENMSRKHVAMTIHGVGFGLDEDEALMAQLGGILDCVEGTETASLCGVERITIVEHDRNRVNRLRQTVSDYFESFDDTIAQRSTEMEWAYELSTPREQTVPASVGSASNGSTAVRPYALVITSDDDSQHDTFFYGIQQPIHSMGLLSERIEVKCITTQSETTEHQLRRMQDAKLVICDISVVTPMLYLYLGYALGNKLPTVLLSKNENADFEASSYDLIRYEKISELEVRLRQWLKRTLAH